MSSHHSRDYWPHRKLPLLPETLLEVLQCIYHHSGRYLDRSVSIGELTVHLRLAEQNKLIQYWPWCEGRPQRRINGVSGLVWFNSFKTSFKSWILTPWVLTPKAQRFVESINANYPDGYWRGIEYVEDS